MDKTPKITNYKRLRIPKINTIKDTSPTSETKIYPKIEGIPIMHPAIILPIPPIKANIKPATLFIYSPPFSTIKKANKKEFKKLLNINLGAVK